MADKSGEVRVKRTGQTALKFRGEQLASAGGRYHAGQEANRWYDLEVYGTEGGKIIVAASYCTCWQGEEDKSTAHVLDNRADVPLALAECRAELDIMTSEYGYPRHEQYADKQSRMLALLNGIWESRVTAILSELGIDEVVE